MEHLGERLPVTKWATRQGTRYSALYNRLAAGWPVEKALAASKAA
ncbi:hypothetical protein LMG32289_00536 [Cupriavidus pampae]|uniref:Transposase n=1 Tax=Cupriavidus pampae TaxID=659251 RepID=A0ABM8WAD4_9BURK|nr:hypothetical protein LMG32289_00536 [Cupriavidus pampae]